MYAAMESTTTKMPASTKDARVVLAKRNVVFPVRPPKEGWVDARMGFNDVCSMEVNGGIGAMLRAKAQSSQKWRCATGKITIAMAHAMKGVRVHPPNHVNAGLYF